jgi:MFS family permease
MATKPVSARVQDLVHSMDVGVGQQVIKGVLYALFVVVLMFLYTGVHFYGLDNAEAMEAAQLGRNLATHGTFHTQVVRPSSLRMLMDRAGGPEPLMDAHPDLLQPPIYPLYLALVFRIMRPDFEPETAGLGVFGPDKSIVWLGGHLFTALTGLFVFFLGCRLFDRRIGVLGATVFFLSNSVWVQSISGTSLPMAGFFVVAALLAVLWAAERQEKSASPGVWVTLLILGALMTLLAGLTRYGALTLAPGLALYIGFAFRKGWRWAAIYLLLLLLGLTPWMMRNHAVSGTLLGMAPRTALVASRNYPDDTFHRTLVPADAPVEKLGRALHSKSLGNLRKFYQGEMRTIGDGFFICLFMVTFLYRFVRRHVHLLRWGLALSMLLTLYGACFFGTQSIALLHLFWPIVILYGLAFFFLMVDRLQLPLIIYRQGITVLLVFFSTIPLILAFTPPRRGFPYPPYAAEIVMNISRLLEPNELMCSDIPWATAWYGNRTSLLLPRDVEEFYQINDTMMRISGLYFTTETRNKPYVRSLRTGRDKDWFQIMEGRMMADFPLTHGFPLFNFDQLFLTDRDRMSQQ